MLSNTTCGMNPTDPRTGIFTLFIYTSLVIWTFRVYCALWFAFYVRITNVIKNTFTRCCNSPFNTFCILATWWRIAWLYDLNWSWSCYKKRIFYERPIFFVKSYLMVYNSVKRDCPQNPQCKYKLEHDFSHCILHWYHKVLGKDLDIFDLYMLFQKGNLNSYSILVYSLVVNQSFQADTCIDIYHQHF